MCILRVCLWVCPLADFIMAFSIQWLCFAVDRGLCTSVCVRAFFLFVIFLFIPRHDDHAQFNSLLIHVQINKSQFKLFANEQIDNNIIVSIYHFPWFGRIGPIDVFSIVALIWYDFFGVSQLFRLICVHLSDLMRKQCTKCSTIYVR